mmetsp:Transcript_47947/g.137686  ORF Transcript_47947/g.137686 Transcript_47947/m.137686 type:complete len:632 (+) Transcript_47947:199-2094(+)
MGAACSPCRENVQTAKKSGASQSSPSPRPARNPGADRIVSAEFTSEYNVQHEGQHRSNMHVKDGGFALKNFMPTNAGKLEDCFEVLSTVIGEGGFGAVRIGKDKRTGKKCAVKSIRKSASDETKRLKEEIEIMRILDHPNIIRFIESFEDARCIYICLELCEGGELFERICKAGHFSEQIGAQCVKQMLLAINYLHQNFIMHRDLKPENWLLATREDVGKAPLRLIDFGISKRFQPGEFAKTKAGTPNYVAPEVLMGRYDEKSDIWSLGVICYVMLSGRHPFSGKTVDQILKAVRAANIQMEPKFWGGISMEAKGLVRACLQKSPSVRPSAPIALSHEWFAAMHTNDGRTSMGNLELSGLKAFGRMNQLKRAACTVIASQLSHPEIAKLKSMFMSMDQNGDGTLAASEIKEGLNKMSIKLPMDLNELLEEVDTDGSGVIDYTEFLAATMDKKLYRQEQVVWSAFNKFDLDGSGAIDKNELAKVLCEEEVMNTMHVAGQQDRLLDIFMKVDSNGDGMIDFEEFFAMMRAAEDGKEPVQRATVHKEASTPKSPRTSPRRTQHNKHRTAEGGKDASPGASSPTGRKKGGAGDGAKIGLANTGWEFKAEERPGSKDSTEREMKPLLSSKKCSQIF